MEFKEVDVGTYFESTYLLSSGGCRMPEFSQSFAEWQNQDPLVRLFPAFTTGVPIIGNRPPQ
jgi:hypothetical protein